MLSLETDDLYQEIQSAVSFRKKHHADMNARIARYAKGHKDDEMLNEDRSLINHQAAFLSVMLPKLIHNNPKSAVSGGRSNTLKARYTKVFLDMWCKYVELRDELKLIARDYLLYWGAAYTTVEADPVLSAYPYRDGDSYLPKTERIPFWDIIIDPACEDYRKGRFVGHIWHADKEDLLEYAKSDKGKELGWEADEIEKLVADGASESDDSWRSEHTPERGEIACATIWVRDYLDDDDEAASNQFHGSLLVLAMDNNEGSRMIRKPKGYHGPKIGPYDLFGYHSIPKTPYPLSPTAMTTQQEQLLAEMSKEATDGAKSYRKIVLVPGGTGAKEAAELAAVGKNLVIEVPGMLSDAAPIEIELGGVTDQQLKNIAYAERQLSLLSGMDSAQQGEVNGDGTATEHAIADSAAKTRTGGIFDGFGDGVNRIMWRAAWYLWNDDRIAIPLSPDLSEGTDEIGMEWIEGGGSDADRVEFMLYSIDIEAMSMERTTEAVQQRRMMQAFEITVQIVPLMRQYPEWDWRRMLGMIGDALNLPDMGDLVDVEMLQQLVGVEVNATQSASEQAAGSPISGAVNQFGFGENREFAGNLTGGAVGAGVA